MARCQHSSKVRIRIVAVHVLGLCPVCRTLVSCQQPWGLDVDDRLERVVCPGPAGGRCGAQLEILEQTAFGVFEVV